jgi:thiamine-phosphate pyrophosphorylase
MTHSTLFTNPSQLYPILSLSRPIPETYLNVFKLLISGGAKIVQLREKRMSFNILRELAFRLVLEARAAQVKLVINDNVKIASEIGADGVHLGQGDHSLSEARALEIPISGVSTHSLDEAIQAESNGADYIGVGPIFRSQTKPELKPIGVKTLEQIRKKIMIPIAAIGGIGPENAKSCFEAGANAVCMISHVIASLPKEGEAISSSKVPI